MSQKKIGFSSQPHTPRSPRLAPMKSLLLAVAKEAKLPVTSSLLASSPSRKVKDKPKGNLKSPSPTPTLLSAPSRPQKVKASKSVHRKIKAKKAGSTGSSKKVLKASQVTQATSASKPNATKPSTRKLAVSTMKGKAKAPSKLTKSSVLKLNPESWQKRSVAFVQKSALWMMQGLTWPYKKLSLIMKPKRIARKTTLKSKPIAAQKLKTASKKAK